ncbi:MAG: bifunctional serine/threonine-protein kinase/formylglycine-generating enzyme family protein [Pseudomonadales bacterium]
MSNDKDITLLRIPAEDHSANDALEGAADGGHAPDSPGNPGIARPRSITGFGRDLRAGELAADGAAADGVGPYPDPRTPRVLKQRFVLDKKLGSGGMGTVYRARDLRKVEAQDRQPYVAVKVLNADFRRHPEAFIALEREASKSQSLSHPHIVSIFDFDKDGDTPFLTMELLEGQELTELIRQFPDGLPDEIAWPVIRGLLSGLRHAHEAGVVHADFKPGNVFVSPSHHTKILDFGIARAVQVNHTVTKSDNTLFDPKRLAALTPAYASREMLNGDSAEIRDDVYSLGVVLYLVLTGHHPYGRLSAKDAAAEGLKPDKPRRLSRRQWKELSRCLRFNRSDRPLELEPLQHALFEPPPWRSRTAGIALVAFCVALGVSYFREDAVLDTVKQEVRASTLLAAQTERLDALLAEPTIDAAWHQRAPAELSSLLSLEGGAELAQDYQLQMAQRLTARISSSDDLASALGDYRAGSLYLSLPAAKVALKSQLESNILRVLDNPAPTEAWLNEVRLSFATARNNFPEHPRWAELNLEAAEALVLQVRSALKEDRFEYAEQALADLRPRMILRPTLLFLENSLVKARQQRATQESVRLTQRMQDDYDVALASLLSDACLSLEPAVVQRHFGDVNQEYPGFANRGLERLDQTFAGCVQELSALNPDRASELQSRSQQLFGALPATAAVRLDPCVPSYLVGNGAQPGRSGYCTDKLADGSASAKLVILPGTGGTQAFGLQKEEVSGAQFARYCQSSGRCNADAADELPVTGIAVDQAQAYARWLSAQTGYTYRLPTLREWQHAAGTELDPNRNCVVDTGTIARGGSAVATGVGSNNEFGLLNMAGNVREWVIGPAQQPRVAGGAFTDPIEDCTTATVRSAKNSGDVITGLRLVREL